MKSSVTRIFCTLAGLVAVVGAPAPAMADDSEVFTSADFISDNSVLPNVLFIMDTSGSMDS